MTERIVSAPTYAEVMAMARRIGLEHIAIVPVISDLETI
jgi:hypothetical protein